MQTKKLLRALAAFLICIVFFTSCSSDSSPVVISCGAGKITAAMYNYWASTGKANFINTYSEIKDTDEFWKTEYTDGKTYAEYFDETVLSDVKLTAVCMMLYNDCRLSVSDADKQKIKSDIDDLVKEYADGNKNQLNKELAKYGINTDILYNIRLQEAKRSVVFDYLYGDNGTEKLTDEKKEEFYQSNYVHFQLIFINNKYEYVLDKDGKNTTNADGSYVTKAMDTETAQKKNALIENVREKLAAGEDFDTLYKEFSELTAYDNGYYYSKTSTYSSSVFYKLIDDISKVQPGETAVSESDYGTYIMKRLPLDEGAWKSSSNADFFDGFDKCASDYSFREYASGYYDKIEINTDALEGLSVANVKSNGNF